jgi:hypothetical protein
MAGDPTAQIPFNYFAGLIPDGYEDCSYESGYLQVITSVVLSIAPPGSESILQIRDPTGNTRISLLANDTGSDAGNLASWVGEFVCGNEGAIQVAGNGSGAFCSVDGYVVAPLGSAIW